MSAKTQERLHEHVKVQRSLRNLIVDGAFWSIMEGFTSNFITPYALFLRASNLTISLLASLPDLLASFFQLLAIKIHETFNSKKRIILAGVFLQAFLWIPIMLIPWYVPDSFQAGALVVGYSFLVMIAYFNGPLWRGMVGELVLEEQRGRYFAKRNKVIAAGSFISALIAGSLLERFSIRNPLLGFSILFLVAFVARIISGLFLSRVYEKRMHNPNIHFYQNYKYTLPRFLKDLNKTDYGRFVLFVCMLRVTVYLSSPFFAVYELEHLGLSYMRYTLLIASEIVASVISLSLWGRLNDERGSKTVLIMSGFLIPFIPLAYLLGTNYYYLILISLFSGLAWAGFNLAVGNFLFDAASPQERVRYVSFYQLFNGISIFIGAVGGGLLLHFLPQTRGSILTVFMISGIGRLLVGLIMLPRLKEMRLIEMPFGKSMFSYPLIIRPRQRFVQDPFDYYLAYPNKPKKPRPRLYLDGEFVREPPDKEHRRKVKESEKKFVEKMLGKDELFNEFLNKK